MLKNQRVLKSLLTLLLLLILSACHSENTQQKQVVKESDRMTTEKNDANQSSETTELDETTTTEVPKETFAEGSLIQAVNDNDFTRAEKILQDKNYKIDEVNAQGETPLLIATHQNLIDMAKLLIDAGADINVQDNISDSPYLYAGAQGKTEILTYMLKKQVPDQEKFNRFGGNALIPAAEKGHLENVKLLLKDGRSDIDHQNNYGYTALIEAVALRDGSSNYQQIIKVLLEAGADKTLRDHTGRTAEDYAESLGYSEMLNILKDY